MRFDIPIKCDAGQRNRQNKGVKVSCAGALKPSILFLVVNGLEEHIMATAAKHSHKKVNKQQAEMAVARQNGKLIFWLILAVLGLGFIAIALS